MGLFLIAGGIMAKKIKWYYHRKGWTSAKKAQEFLGQKNVEQPEFVIANKVKYPREEALALLRKCDAVLVAKGKKLLRFNLKEEVSDDELAKAALGRSGTLRAPAIQIGKTLIVGFHAEAYEELFG